MKDSEKKLYEVSFLVKSEGGAAAVSGYLTRAGAEIVKEEELNKIKLTYPIKGEESAFLGSIICKLAKDAVSGIEHEANLDKEVLRAMIVTQPLSTDAGNRGARRLSSDRDTAQDAGVNKRVKKEKAEDEVLSNELLEEKLEEILQ